MRRVIWLGMAGLLACGPMFYQAPPPIGEYPERLPAKRWSDLFLERAPLDPKLPVAAALDAECLALPERLAKLAPGKRVAEVDRLLEVNREGPYAVERANFLHELRELLEDGKRFEAVMGYFAVRFELMKPLPVRPPGEKPWSMEQEEFDARWAAYEAAVEARRLLVEDGLGKAEDFLKPYWQVQQGADLFRKGEAGKAREIFEAVIEAFPEHPRAEVARLMVARCLIEEARALGRKEEATDEDEERVVELYHLADTGLQEFIKRYPKGRFTADAHGWRGAVAFDRGELGDVVRHQIARYERQPTREILRSVMMQCDEAFLMMLEREMESEDQGDGGYWLSERGFPAEELAGQPLIARLFVQAALDPAVRDDISGGDNTSGDRATIRFLERRIFRPKPFVRAALRELGSEMVKVRGEADETMLCLLAWAASEEGEHGQGVALLDRIAAKEPRDETMHARAVILQRAGRHGEAVEAFDALAAAWPESRLLGDLGYRRGFSLFHAGRAAEALLEFSSQVEEEFKQRMTREGTAGFVSLQPQHHLVQWQDSLLQFAPLDEVEKAVLALKEGDRRLVRFREVLRARALAAGDFERARRHLSVGDLPEAMPWERGYHPMGALFLNEAGWAERVEPLVALYQELESGPPASEVARIHLAIARHWAAQRGRLTLPSLEISAYANSEWEKQGLLRRENAVRLGFAREAVMEELDGRDELTHAIRHAREAAKGADGTVAAAALELANEGLFRRSEFSLYQRARALETDATGISAELTGELRRRFPKSAEAKRAVGFWFTPAVGAWMPGDYTPWRSSEAMVDALTGRRFDRWEDDPEEEEAYAKIEAMPAKFEDPEAGMGIAKLRRDLDGARAEVQKLRAKTDPTSQGGVLAVIGRLDDLAAALAVPGVTMEDFRNYVGGQRKKLPGAFASLLEFDRRMEPVLDGDGMEVGKRRDTIDGWREFLERYPESPKAEVASFRMVRLVARQQRSRVSVAAFAFPEAPIFGGYKRVAVTRNDPEGRPELVLAALDEHDARFPKGRYRDDLDLLRAGALMDAGRMGEALFLIDRVLSNPMQRDLMTVAGLHFAELAQGLLEVERREGVVGAFREHPQSLVWLERLVAGDTFLRRLEPMMPWLRERVRGR